LALTFVFTKKGIFMLVKRIAIGFAVTLAMALCLSLVSNTAKQNQSMLADEKNIQVLEQISQ